VLTVNFVLIRVFFRSDDPTTANPVPLPYTTLFRSTVSGDGDTTGGYQFRLFDLATANSIAPGTPVSDTLNPANVTKAYQFTAAEVGRAYVCTPVTSGPSNAWSRLIDPYNNMVFSAS